MHVRFDAAAIDGDENGALDLMLRPFPATGISAPAARARPVQRSSEANGEDLDGHGPLSLSEAARDTGVAIAAILLRAALDRRGHGARRSKSVSPSGAVGYGSEPQPEGLPGADRGRCPAAPRPRCAAEG